MKRIIYKWSAKYKDYLINLIRLKMTKMKNNLLTNYLLQ